MVTKNNFYHKTFKYLCYIEFLQLLHFRHCLWHYCLGNMNFLFQSHCNLLYTVAICHHWNIFLKREEKVSIWFSAWNGQQMEHGIKNCVLFTFIALLTSFKEGATGVGKIHKISLLISKHHLVVKFWTWLVEDPPRNYANRLFSWVSYVIIQRA